MTEGTDLYISKGSCGDVTYMLYLAVGLSKISGENFNKLHSLCVEISKMLSGLIKTL